MRMFLVVVVEPFGDLVKRRGGVGHGADAEVVALQGVTNASLKPLLPGSPPA
jgi:hypothetical protein